ncbi:hypothetical protein ACIA8O_38975 [Kitasatospora sp. NPDC051853]|uniref:hypothetical protein n=1 Tax=Kitasatospora sp. NPDC051853 TaxID=3364058 RepID=UPI0037B098E1
MVKERTVPARWEVVVPDDAEADKVDNATVEALGMLSKALEYTERARGHLYAVHQMTGGADRMLAQAVEMLRQAGHEQQADLVEREILGRDVIPGMWTYQVIEAYDDTYYKPFTTVEEQVRQGLAGGRRHLAEARMQRAARERRRQRPSP